MSKRLCTFWKTEKTTSASKRGIDWSKTGGPPQVGQIKKKEDRKRGRAPEVALRWYSTGIRKAGGKKKAWQTIKEVSKSYWEDSKVIVDKLENFS